MRVLFGSDIHLEFGRGYPPVPASEVYDMVILGGDIDLGAAGISWAAQTFADRDVIYVPGNHEYYDRDFDACNALMESSAADVPGLHLLAPGTVVLNGVRVIGAPLWSALVEPGISEGFMPAYLRGLERDISDFHVIRRAGRRWSANDCREVFRQHVAFLERELARPYDGTTIVITHFLPTRTAIAPEYEGDPMNGYFASALDYLMESYSRMSVQPFWVPRRKRTARMEDMDSRRGTLLIGRHRRAGHRLNLRPSEQSPTGMHYHSRESRAGRCPVLLTQVRKDSACVKSSRRTASAHTSGSPSPERLT